MIYFIPRIGGIKEVDVGEQVHESSFVFATIKFLSREKSYLDHLLKSKPARGSRSSHFRVLLTPQVVYVEQSTLFWT
jgi:hypothetical protein